MSRCATVVLGILAIVLGIVFEKQNVAFMVGLAFAIAASCNFPVLVMSIFWKGSPPAAPSSAASLGLVARSDAGLPFAGRLGSDAWQSEGFGALPLRQPGAVLDPDRLHRHLLVSKLDASQRGKIDRKAFDAQYVRSQTGIGASGAAAPLTQGSRAGETSPRLSNSGPARAWRGGRPFMPGACARIRRGPAMSTPFDAA